MQRRFFLAAAAAPAFAQTRPANSQIRVGVVGPGGRGTAIMKECIEFGSKYNARVTAACDIWNQRRDAAAKLLRETYSAEPKIYARFSDMVSDRELDAIIIATPDHAHAKMLKAAVEAGKDVYCEKPMGNILSELLEAYDAVKKSGRIVQVGTQRRADPKYRAASRMIAEGRIGDVVKVDVIWNEYSPFRWARTDADLRALKETDVDWKEFLAGKPDRPFDPRVYRSFRLFREFSSGIIDQWMTHGIDVVHLLTGEPYPITVMASGVNTVSRDYRENPDTVQVALEYGNAQRRFLANYSTCLANGAGAATRVQGTLGTVETENVWRISGDGIKSPKAIQAAQPIADEPGTVHHMANWLDCVRRRDATSLYASVEAGFGHSIACIMATQSLWSGRRLVFDPRRRTVEAG